MEAITQELADFIEQRVKEALIAKEEKLKKLELEKTRLLRMASELKNEVKNMKVTVSMFEKRMNNPARNIIKQENKCVGCDFRVNPSPDDPLYNPLFSSVDSVVVKQEDEEKTSAKINLNEVKLEGNLDNWVKRMDKPSVTAPVEMPVETPMTTSSVIKCVPPPPPPPLPSSSSSELQTLLIAPLPFNTQTNQTNKSLSPVYKRQKSDESNLDPPDDKPSPNRSESNGENNADVEIIDLSDEEDKINEPSSST